MRLAERRIPGKYINVCIHIILPDTKWYIFPNKIYHLIQLISSQLGTVILDDYASLVHNVALYKFNIFALAINNDM